MNDPVRLPDAFIRLVRKSNVVVGVAAGVPTLNVDPLDADAAEIELAGVLTLPDDPPELTLAAEGAGEARSRIHAARRSGEDGSTGGAGRVTRPDAWSIARCCKAERRVGAERDEARSGKARRRSSGGMELRLRGGGEGRWDGGGEGPVRSIGDSGTGNRVR